MNEQGKSSNDLSKDSLTDIKALFMELFVNEINEKFDDMNGKFDATKTQIENISQKENEHYEVLDDELDQVKQKIAFLGEPDDWGKDKLPPFLNRLAQQIGGVKDEIIGKPTPMENDSEPLPTLIKIKEAIDNNQSKLDKLSEDLSTEFSQLHKESTVLKKEVTTVKEQYETGGLIYDLSLTCNNLENEVHNSNLYLASVSESIVGLNQKYEKTEKDLYEYNLMVTNYESKVTGYFNDLKNNLEQAIVNLGDYTKKKFLYLYMGIGFSITINIIMFLIMLLK